MFESITRPIKRMSQMLFSRETFRIFTLPRSRFDYRREVGDGTGSSTVAAPVLWVARTFPEAPPALWQKGENNQNTQIWDHPMLRLLEKPNDFYSGHILWMASLCDWMVDGNAYWLKIRARSGLPAELWWTPSWMIEPRSTDQNTYVTHYDYTVDGVTPPFDTSTSGRTVALDPKDVIHFRYGLDPHDQKKGQSPLKSVLREVFTDDEAAAFTASLLRNMGIPGLLVSPDQDSPISDEDAQATKAYMQEKFSGDKRGEPMVMTSKTKVQQFGFSPDQMLLKELRRIPEERVTAVTGVPAIVAGLGAGLDRSTFTNMAEAREAAYESALIPMQRIISADLRHQLLSEFENDPFSWIFGFDLTHVRVLQEDRYREVQRHDLAVRGGWEMVSEARRAVGLEVDDQRDNVFLRQANVNAMHSDIFSTPRPNGNGAQPAPANGSVSLADVGSVVDEALTRAFERDRLLTK